jgi:spore maturation protein SpmA
MHISGYLKQSVNSVLALSLLGLMVFWVGLFYFTHKATSAVNAANSYQALYAENS